jgi:hypothetical protein
MPAKCIFSFGADAWCWLAVVPRAMQNERSTPCPVEARVSAPPMSLPGLTRQSSLPVGRCLDRWVKPGDDNRERGGGHCLQRHSRKPSDLPPGPAGRASGKTPTHPPPLRGGGETQIQRQPLELAPGLSFLSTMSNSDGPAEAGLLLSDRNIVRECQERSGTAGGRRRSAISSISLLRMAAANSARFSTVMTKAPKPPITSRR